jgi:hypothetical protein
MKTAGLNSKTVLIIKPYCINYFDDKLNLLGRSIESRRRARIQQEIYTVNDNGHIRVAHAFSIPTDEYQYVDGEPVTLVEQLSPNPKYTLGNIIWNEYTEHACTILNRIKQVPNFLKIPGPITYGNQGR